MKVVLLEDVKNVGGRHEVKEVSDGFALNFLIPQGKARFADEKTVSDLESKQKAAEADKKERVEETLKKLEALKKTGLTISAKANEEGHLFAKLDSHVVAEVLEKEYSTRLDSRDILLEPIKEVEEHTIAINVGEKKVEVALQVKAEK